MNEKLVFMSTMLKASVYDELSYQDAIEFLAKSNLHGGKLGLRVEILHNILLLGRNLPDRLSQSSLGQGRLDMRIRLDFSRACQKPVDDLLVDAHRLKFGGRHLEEARGL